MRLFGKYYWANYQAPWQEWAAAKSLQSCPTLCDPIDSSPPRSPVPGILQARTLEWVAISFSNAWNVGLEEAQAGIKIAGRNINNLRYADDTTLMTESEEELKSLLMKVKVESEKGGLKLNIQKMKIMASGPITSWEIDGETVSDFIFGGSKITAAMKLKDVYSLEEKLWPT